MSKQSVASPVIDFEDTEWDGPDVALNDILEDNLLGLLASTVQKLNSIDESRQTTNAAIGNALESCLLGIDMILLERDADPITSVSIENGSWEAEMAPVPCDMDTWLRAAIPENAASTSRPANSFAMAQFLQQPSVSRKSAPSRPNSAKKPAASSPVKSSATATPPSVPQRVIPSPEQRKREDRLREEIKIRRAQAAKAKELEAKDAAEKERLVSFAKGLKGRDYSYDHKGQVVVLSEPGHGGLQPNNASYRLPSLEDSLEAESSGTHSQGRAGANLVRKSAGNAGSTKKGSGRGADQTKERKLVSNYRETASKSQPPAMETLKPMQGVTLRQGGLSKSGPQRPSTSTRDSVVALLTMTRDEYSKYLASKKQKQSDLSGALQVSPSATLLEGVKSKSMGGAPDAAAGTTPVPSSVTGDAQAPSTVLPTAATAAADPAAVAAALDAAVAVTLSGARLKQQQQPGGPGDQPPSTPDVNLLLVRAADWGVGAAGGKGYEAPPSLPFVKPDERMRGLEVGRTERLPRDRANQATMSPPLSPTRSPAKLVTPSVLGRVNG
ncbi:hypothetical protein CEUSTIGMA_g10260.t1 [Chlamydomonas eustigma]|uniref:Uncharacterized protein n=1 Tax=Chlamydomonas eustigma TaxID=1157962 RepID=A0A250XIC8_9CHLO|nr:hypothetical protein CEUSTIGMA_g10260.t1 [Chlamydomonas eustigma]|eukprot:GAX82834.1 hypothetical protein CEUSTIGMA_g10260.t1 [Chlamydomonas eustigma]